VPPTETPADPDPHGRDATRRRQAVSFGPAAGLYDDIRPRYPEAAATWVLAPLGAGRWRVADIGAGTGIMSRLLESLGHDVVAVEPDERMRQRLLERSPGGTAVAGTAESVPLPDGDVDAAVAAQSYHWFDREVAHAELARVVRTGGVFAAVWNDRDESWPWVAELTRIIEDDRGSDPFGAGPGESAPPSFGGEFDPVVAATFRHTTRHTPDSLLALVASRSYYITATPARQVEIRRRVRDLCADHPDLAGRTGFELPYVTRVYRAVRR
jgi:SAM-dependent methyltransferase